MLLLYIISTVLMSLNKDLILCELHAYVLLLLVQIQMLVATKKVEGRGTEVHDQMPLRNLN